MRLRRLATVAVLAAAMVGSAAATSSAEPKPDPHENYLTATKYDAVTFGMSKQQVEAIIGTQPHCSGGSSVMTCWGMNQFVDQTADFSFNAAGQLFKKEKSFTFAYAWYTYDLPRTMTKVQYEQEFAVGDTLAEVNAIIAGTACTDMWVERPNYPSSSGWNTMIECAGTIDESYPTINFYFTDGQLTSKSYSSRLDSR
ncbi:BLIP family beta-lactamase inhibitor [Streptomyces sp. NPDC057136]|uniref:BLIP family beta-lactamase inhibitor n=1 Tax=Streptomyces sp. NPDC057136 TaxID=3346029 RepID=UPI003642CF56